MEAEWYNAVGQTGRRAEIKFANFENAPKTKLLKVIHVQVETL
jgi:hypothetical protein